MVRNAAKLAVYEETIIKVKKHQIAATIRVDMALEQRQLSTEEFEKKNSKFYLGATSEPCWSKAPVVNQSELFMVN